ncbi:SPRY domain-containing protein [Cardiosporidium cionae]|uniref:SPRY domain-containing protein n=1 Tax=Cardiosporidium cionae TaxID=476202 RepID=A0ABQ7JDK3_9APIC|nr:SPRY domain-containing protein [Cardiosporidium cionae]|eukprot:KAF8822097.1 SPRY domain-containing protein [Cardiosporidium cionae]
MDEKTNMLAYCGSRSVSSTSGPAITGTVSSSCKNIALPPHPHDQHIRHNTHDISARGGRKRGKQDEITLSQRQAKSYKAAKPAERRDDFLSPVLSVRYCDPMLHLSLGRLQCIGYKGWGSIFATHCAEKGKWYYEVKIIEGVDAMKSGSISGDGLIKEDWHVRVGWACRYQRYDVPIAHDAFGYGFRDIDGTVINSALRRPYAKQSFGVGDVIGCYLCLMEPNWWLIDPRKDRKLYEFLQAGILCNPKEPPNPSPNPGSFIEFSINGRRFGKAFENIYNGSYHPALSLYMGARLQIVLGPEFEYPPDPRELWRPAIDLMRPYVP